MLSVAIQSCLFTSCPNGLSHAEGPLMISGSAFCRCNGDAALLEVLAAAGACFDCASEAEIAAVLGCGVGAEHIIFANACKRPSDIRSAFVPR